MKDDVISVMESPVFHVGEKPPLAKASELSLLYGDVTELFERFSGGYNSEHLNLVTEILLPSSKSNLLSVLKTVADENELDKTLERFRFGLETLKEVCRVEGFRELTRKDNLTKAITFLSLQQGLLTLSQVQTLYKSTLSKLKYDVPSLKNYANLLSDSLIGLADDIAIDVDGSLSNKYASDKLSNEPKIWIEYDLGVLKSLEGSNVLRNIKILMDTDYGEFRGIFDDLLFHKLASLYAGKFFVAETSATTSSRLLSRMYRAIENGKSCLLPAGYTYEGLDGGHFMLVEVFKKDDDLFDVKVFNSSWINLENAFPEKLTGERDSKDIFYLTHTDYEDLDLWTIARHHYFNVERKKWSLSNPYDIIYDGLNAIKKELPAWNYMRTQRSGTCAGQGLIAYLRHFGPV